MWPSGLAKSVKKSPVKRSAEESDDWSRRGFGDTRSRHPMFQMPNWMYEDEDVSNLASRMSQAPHWSTMGRRGGPRRERRNSGGSAMSGNSEDDVVDSPHFDRTSHSSGASNRSEPTSHTIPIRIEAEAPPGCQPVQPVPQEPPKETKTEDTQNSSPDGFNPQMRVGNQPPYASKTTPAVDTCQEDVLRDARSASAPPDVNKQGNDNSQRFVTKMNITPQQTNRKAPVFNNVAKPFTSGKAQDLPSPIEEEQSVDDTNDKSNIPPTEQIQHPQVNPQYQEQQQPQYQKQQFYQQGPQTQQQPPPSQHGGQKPSVVRNIPIFVEGREGANADEGPRSMGVSPPENQQQYQHSDPQRQATFGNVPHGVSQEPMFTDPFFEFPRGPTQQLPRQSQQAPTQHQYYQQQQPSQQQYYQQPPQQQFYEQQPSQQQFYQQHPYKQQPAQQQQFQQPAQQQQFQQKQAYQQQPTQQQQFQKQPAEQHPPPKETTEEIPQQKEPPKDYKMDKINSVRALLTEYEKSVISFSGTEKNKEYLYIDEMLTRALLELDNIDPDSRDDVRQTRRVLIKDINATIAALERKVTPPQGTSKTSQEKNVEPMVVDNDGEIVIPQSNIEKGKVEQTKVEIEAEQSTPKQGDDDQVNKNTDMKTEHKELKPNKIADTEIKMDVENEPENKCDQVETSMEGREKMQEETTDAKSEESSANGETSKKKAKISTPKTST